MKYKLETKIKLEKDVRKINPELTDDLVWEATNRVLDSMKEEPFNMINGETCFNYVIDHDKMKNIVLGVIK